MIFNKITQTHPFLAHGPGKKNFLPLWDDLIELRRLFPLKQKSPHNLTVVTFNNGEGFDEKPLGLLEEFLESTVLGAGVKNWNNVMKIELLSNFLDSVKTNYVLVCDSCDVFVLRNLSDLVTNFQKMNCSAVFNSEKLNWPFDLPQYIIDFELMLNLNLRLNAGVWIANTDFAKQILAVCNKAPPHKFSEQWYYKHAYFELWPQMKVDYNNFIFQGLNRVDKDEIDLMKLF